MHSYLFKIALNNYYISRIYDIIRKSMKWLIYKHTNLINGKSYIGQTSQNTLDRWRKGNGYKNNIYFFNSIQKYGWNNFSHEIIETNIQTLKKANEREIYWISYYNSYKNGYNLTLGGDNKEHLGIPVLQINPKDLQIINSYKTIRAAEEATGIDHSQISRCCLKNKKNIMAGKYYWCFQDEWFKNWTPKTKKSYNITTKKQVYQLDKNFNIVNKFDSILAAEKTTGIQCSSISQCCNGKRVSSGGYYWCYIKDYNTFIPLLPLDEKPVIRININDYENIKMYNNISVAAKENNIHNPELISRVCKGKQLSAGGFYWVYQEDHSLNWKPRQNKNFTKVKCIETGIIYNSIKEAIEKTGASSAIKRCIKSPSLKSGGYHWRKIT